MDWCDTFGSLACPSVMMATDRGFTSLKRAVCTLCLENGGKRAGSVRLTTERCRRGGRGT